MWTNGLTNNYNTASTYLENGRRRCYCIFPYLYKADKGIKKFRRGGRGPDLRIVSFYSSYQDELLPATCLYSKKWISQLWDRVTVTNIIQQPPAFRGRLQIYYNHSAIYLMLFIPNILLQIPADCFCAGLELNWKFSSRCTKGKLNTFKPRRSRFCKVCSKPIV